MKQRISDFKFEDIKIKFDKIKSNVKGKIKKLTKDNDNEDNQ